MFNNNKSMLFSFALSSFFLSSISFNLSSSSSTLTTSPEALIQAEIIKVDQLGTNITDLLENLNKNISQIINDIQTNKALDLEILKSLFKNYPSAKLSELLVLQKDKLSDKLEAVLILSGIQASILSAISSLENRRKKCSIYTKMEAFLLNQLDKKIDSYVHKIQNLMHSFKYQLKISSSKSIASSTENQIMDTLLEKCDYRKILDALNIKTSAAIEEFKNITKQIAKNFLTATDLTNIQTFLNSTTFSAIKNNPEKLQTIFNQISPNFSSSVKTIREKTEAMVNSCL